MSISLITDRTLADVDARNAKGSYNASDLNRVETAVQTISGELQTAESDLETYAAAKGVAQDAMFLLPYHGADLTVTVRTDWARGEKPAPEHMTRYLSNVKKISGAMGNQHPTLPGSMARLTYEGANNIERSLELVEPALEDAVARIRDRIDRTAANVDLGWALGIAHIGRYGGI